MVLAEKNLYLESAFSVRSQGVACSDVAAAYDTSATGTGFTCGTCPDGYSGNGWDCSPCPLNVSIPYASFNGATVPCAAAIKLFGKARF